MKFSISRRSTAIALLGAGLIAATSTYLLAFAQGNAPEARTPPGDAGGKGRKERSPGARPQPVKATQARIGSLDVAVTALGTITASNTATVKPRVDGQLIRINFREGQLVKSGDVLAEIDPRPFQIQLDQVRGQLLKDEALLAAAKVDLDRYQGLLAKDSIAKQQVDTQEALVRQYRGTVEADRALEANARLQLSFARVTSPAAGRLGLRQVDVGNMVRSSDANGLVVITQTQPIHLVFAIPSESLGNVVGRLQKGDALVVEAWSRDSKTLLSEGKLISVDNQIDVTTGTVKLKAEFANRDNSLFPNQFVNARLKVETRRDSVLLPNAAIQRNAQGSFVYVINNEEQTVDLRPVSLGPVSGDTVIVDSGLAATESVVLDGADRLRPGARVEVLSLDGQAQAGDSALAENKNPERRQERRHRREAAESVKPVVASSSPR